MQQIIYISTARGELSLPVVEHILDVSRRNNSRDELSGLLLVGNRRFLQVLEGPTQMLDATYRRIQADPRHFALVKLSSKPIAKRSFPDCRMGYRDATIPASVEGLTGIVARLTNGLIDPSLEAELRSFAALHDRAA